MTFIGVATILGALLPSVALIGLPLLLAGLALLGARAALDRAPFIPPDLVPFFTKLRAFFCCWGWGYILGLFLVVFVLLAYSGIALWALSTGQVAPHTFFAP
jgi:hypothetical protein